MVSAALLKWWLLGAMLILPLVMIILLAYSRAPHYRGRAKGKVTERRKKYSPGIGSDNKVSTHYYGRYVFEVEGEVYTSDGHINFGDYIWRRVGVHYDLNDPAKCCTWCEDPDLWLLLFPAGLLVVWIVITCFIASLVV